MADQWSGRSGRGSVGAANWNPWTYSWTSTVPPTGNREQVSARPLTENWGKVSVWPWAAETEMLGSSKAQRWWDLCFLEGFPEGGSRARSGRELTGSVLPDWRVKCTVLI